MAWPASVNWFFAFFCFSLFIQLLCCSSISGKCIIILCIVFPRSLALFFCLCVVFLLRAYVLLCTFFLLCAYVLPCLFFLLCIFFILRFFSSISSKIACPTGPQHSHVACPKLLRLIACSSTLQ
jgi:hypothetical protein